MKHLGITVAVAALGVCAGATGAWAASRVDPAPAAAAQTQRSYEDYVADLGSTDPDTRVRALRTLAASGYPEALGAMAALLGDPVDGIQLETINHVLDFYATARPSGARRVALIVEVRSKGGSAERVFDQGPFVILPRRTPPELPAGLAVAMRDQNPQVRVEAAYTLGVVARPPLDPAVASVLQGGLRDAQREMRLASARVLGALRVGQAGDALIEAVNDPDKDVKAAAMRALGDIREARAVQALTEQFRYYEKGALADAALDGLARIAHPSSAPLFASLLSDRSPVTRRRAAEGLARCGDRQAASAVATALASERQADVRLARAFAAEAAGQGGLDALVAGLASDATEAQALSYLVELGQPVASRLAAYLGGPEPRIRGRVAMALGLIGGEDALAALEPVRRDPDTEVARAAERAIARIRLGQR